MENLLMYDSAGEDNNPFCNLTSEERVQQIQLSLKSISLSAFQEFPTKKKKKKKESVRLESLKDLTPLNLVDEELRFRLSDHTINPVFVYKQPIRSLQQFNTLDTEHEELALKILKAHKSEYLKLKSSKEDVLGEDEVISTFNEFVQLYGLRNVDLELQANAVCRTRVRHLISKKSLVVMRSPVEYTRSSLIGALNHEIATHILRRRNQQKQPFFKNREQLDLSKQCKETEEGLASIHQVLHQQTPSLFVPALRYYSCILASRMSFADLFNQLKQWLGGDQKESWRQVVRVKRGTEQTVQPGGVYKDQIYLKGAIKVLKSRKNPNFLQLLHGKFSVYDLDKLNNLKIEKGVIPMFAKDQKSYLQTLDKIALLNFIQ